MYKLIVFALALILILSAVFFKKWRKENADLFNVIVTIVGTFLGIYAGLLVANNSEANKTNERILNLIDVSLAELDNNISDINYLIENSHDSLEVEISALFKTNGLPQPEIFELMLQNELFQNECCFSTIGNSITVNQVVKKVRNLIIKIDNPKGIITRGELYVNELKLLSKILFVERERLKGDIDCESVDKKQFEIIQNRKIEHIIKNDELNNVQNK